MVSEPSFVTMTKTRPLSALTDKVNALSKTTELHQVEMHEIHQKLDAVTSVLQTLSETMQNFIEAGHCWQQRLSFPSGSNQQESVLTVIPKAVRLEFHKFKGENPLRWVFKFHQFFQLYNTPPNQKIWLASYHTEDEALVWFQDAEESRQFMSWEAFVRALHVRFGASAYDDPLTRLRQVSSIAIYEG